MGQVDPLVRGPKWVAGKAWTGKIDLSKAALSNGFTCTPLSSQQFHWENEEQEKVKGGD